MGGEARGRGKWGRKTRDEMIRQIAEDWPLSNEGTLDRLLLVLFDALLSTQAEDWTERKVANLPADEKYELARWWPLGQSVAKHKVLRTAARPPI